MDIAERFSENMVRYRKQLGVSQEELGIRASLHRTEISNLERGFRLPRIDTLVKLAGALEVSPEALLEGMVWRPGEMRAGGFGGVDCPRFERQVRA